MAIDLDDFYAALRSRSGAFEISELGTIRAGETAYPILRVRRPAPAPSARRMLIVAGVHGNETAGLLAVPAILDRLAGDPPPHAGWDVTVVAPANPVGVAHVSRYNGDGCDVNRDLSDPRTVEAYLLRGLVERDRPDLIVSLHEGPQDGFLIVVTSPGSRELGEAAVRAVSARGIRLAPSHFAGFSLGSPGISAEGAGTDFLKWLLRLHTLGRFATDLDIGTYTTETSWSAEDVDARVLAHVVSVEALLAAGAALEPDAPAP